MSPVAEPLAAVRTCCSLSAKRGESSHKRIGGYGWYADEYRQIEDLLDGSGVAYRRGSALACWPCIKCKISPIPECTVMPN